jgi:predicted N-formylglutamate amidohydrolase
VFIPRLLDHAIGVAMKPWRLLPGAGDVLTIVDHASNHVPDDIDLGIDPPLLETHIGWDIGAAALAEALGFPVFLASVSRLVVDLNREEDAPDIVPLTSDGIAIPGNAGIGSGRIERFWRPYHDALEAQIIAMKPKLLVSLHSFTPSLSSRLEEARPWEIGILYNRDDSAARSAIPLLEAAGVNVGDQLPYSGKILNATMNRHGEGTGTPYLGVEVRQDLIDSAAGVAKWKGVLLPVIEKCAKRFGTDTGDHCF